MTASFPLSRKKKPAAKPLKRRPDRPVRQERSGRPGLAMGSGNTDLADEQGEIQSRFELSILKAARIIGIPLTEGANAREEPDAPQIILAPAPGQGKRRSLFMRLFGPILRVGGILLLLSFAVSVAVQFIQGYLDDQALQEQAQTEESPSGTTGSGPSSSDDQYRNLDR